MVCLNELTLSSEEIFSFISHKASENLNNPCLLFREISDSIPLEGETHFGLQEFYQIEAGVLNSSSLPYILKEDSSYSFETPFLDNLSGNKKSISINPLYCLPVIKKIDLIMGIFPFMDSGVNPLTKKPVSPLISHNFPSNGRISITSKDLEKNFLIKNPKEYSFTTNLLFGEAEIYHFLMGRGMKSYENLLNTLSH